MLAILPFQPGWRPTERWLGSSDATALILGDPAVANRAYVLYTLTGVAGDGYAVEAVLAGGTRAVTPVAFAPDGTLEPVAPDADRPLVLALDPEQDFAPAGFDTLFTSAERVQLRLMRDGEPVAGDETTLAVCDARRCGSLYQRVIERVIGPDAERQRASTAAHPWYPVLRIGSEKAVLYTRALVGDIVHKQHHLSDPGWLLRVGVYLEFLTCLGIADAVREVAGDLLTPDERAAFESGDAFAPIRERLDAAAWGEVWALRHVAHPRARNLLAKKRATLSFLEVHHEDLKQAIELAGPNLHDAQEIWQRVFRDAERAVLSETDAAFPELALVPDAVRPIARRGLYASACRQYRASMNHVASWARKRGLMDFTGGECVPLQASLIGDPERAKLLQQRDGAGVAPVVRSESIAAALAGLEAFETVDPASLDELAATARPVALGPMQRLVVQGGEGRSLFVVARGSLEVVLRREGRSDLRVDLLAPGDVVGEMALLTGAPRSATVRALDDALVYEVGERHYRPLLDAHPEGVEELARLMDRRLRARHERLAHHDARRPWTRT